MLKPSVLVIPRSAIGVTVVSALAVLFDRLVSGVALVMPVRFVMVPGLPGAVTTIVMMLVAPAPNDARVHATLPLF